MIRVLPDEYLKIFRRLHSCWRLIFLLPMVWWMYSSFTSSPAFDAQTMTVFGHAFRTEDLVESYFIAIGLSLAVLGFVFVVVLKVICPKCRTPLAYDVLHHLLLRGPPEQATRGHLVDWWSRWWRQSLRFLGRFHPDSPVAP
jgi:uncharacterized membrane protein